MRHQPRPRAPSTACPYATHSSQLPVLAVIDLLNVLLAIRVAFRSQGFSPWPPRTLRLSARPRSATARGARSRQPGPPQAAHTPSAPGPQQAPAARQAVGRKPALPRQPSFFRGEPSPLRPPLRPPAPVALPVA